MKVGDYVRTKNGIIGKIIDKNMAEVDDRYELDYNNKLYYYYQIAKSSSSIIDLLEEHDLVVIEYYSLRYKERVARLFEVDFKDKKFIVLKNAYCDFMLENNKFNAKDKKLKPIIKSIITKEQIESIKYEVNYE